MSNSINEKNIKLQKKINYFFKDLSLLKIALTHSSYLKKTYNYERLEFLGDSIIGSIVSEALFLKFNNHLTLINFIEGDGFIFSYCYFSFSNRLGLSLFPL